MRIITLLLRKFYQIGYWNLDPENRKNERHTQIIIQDNNELLNDRIGKILSN